MKKSSKRGIKQLDEILNTLEHGKSLFTFTSGQNIKKPSEAQLSLTSENDKYLSDLKKLDKNKRIYKILEKFVDEFEVKSLPNASSVQNYVLFLVTVLKISKKMKMGHDQSLILAHTLSRLNMMFVKYPINYTRRAINDPLLLLFLVTEFAVEAGRGLDAAYRFDEVTFHQFLTVATRFCAESENPLIDITSYMSTMPKARLSVVIGEEHQKIIGSVLQYCSAKMPIKTRIESATRLLSKITTETNDSVVLKHYNTLKIFLEKDSDLRKAMAKLAKSEIVKTRQRRFVGTILEELAA